jgi:hypothetical protein
LGEWILLACQHIEDLKKELLDLEKQQEFKHEQEVEKQVCPHVVQFIVTLQFCTVTNGLELFVSNLCAANE